MPSDWSSVADVKTIQVEFRPQDPYSHNIWCVGLERDLYIATSANGTRWTPFVAQDPRVRARVGTALYELLAVNVTDAAERTRVADAYGLKYDLVGDDNWVTRRVDIPARSTRLASGVNDSVFFEFAFLALVASSILAPAVIFGLMLWKRAMSRTTVLLFGVMLILLSGIDVALLVTLESAAKLTSSLIDDRLFASGDFDRAVCAARRARRDGHEHRVTALDQASRRSGARVRSRARGQSAPITWVSDL